MICNHCHSELPEGALFCPYCGLAIAPTPPEPVAAVLDQPTVDQPYMPEDINTAWAMPIDVPAPNTVFCGHCGNQVPTDAAVCSFCGLPPTTVVDPPALVPPQEKKSRLGLWILAAVASILVVLAIAGLCTNWFGFYGPGSQIISAAEKTLSAGSFTIDFSTTMVNSNRDSEQKTEGTIEVMLDIKERELMMYTELEAEGTIGTMAIYDNYLILGVKNNYLYLKRDISEELEAFFDNCESTKELDWEELLNSINEDLYDEIGETIDFDQLEKCIFTYVRKLNSTKWLKDNAGYSSTKENGVKLHQFKPKTYKFLNASLECFEDAFEDEDDYKEMMDGLKDSKSEMNRSDCEVTFGIKSGKLTTFEMEVDQESNSFHFELKFKKIGETSIDKDDLVEMLNMAS
jgi:hypothetical protein